MQLLHELCSSSIARRDMPLTVPCSWEEMQESVKCLRIMSPDTVFDTCLVNVLTYIKDGM